MEPAIEWSDARPVTFDIDLDGSRHSAIATWPDDMNQETWYIDLDLAPPLPRAE
jgi:hypothetical protein